MAKLFIALEFCHYKFHAVAGQTLGQKPHHGSVLKGENRHILKKPLCPRFNFSALFPILILLLDKF